MLTYKAMYKVLDDGVHAEVLDFPGRDSRVARAFGPAACSASVTASSAR